MGNARWSNDDWRSYSTTTRALPTERIFTNHLKEALDPSKIQFRESCDSTNNPLSTPIILGLDVTGSMGFIADNLARTGLGKLVEDTLNLRPVTDPHFMFMAIGDVAAGDRAPLQVTQFEADIRIGEQLRDIWLVKGGGGNNSESYHLPWHFASTRTRIDSWTKRQRKGFIFTVGDEMPPGTFTKRHQEAIYGVAGERDETLEDLLVAAREQYHVFHIIAQEGSYARSHGPEVLRAWTNLLGENALVMEDHRELSEIVVQAMLRANAGLAYAEPMSHVHEPERAMDL